MRVIKKINNNVALCIDHSGREVIAMGKGLGFGQIPREVPLREIERTFYDIDDTGRGALRDMPDNVLLFAARVIDAANMPNLFVMADLRHFVWSEEPFEDIVRYKDLVRHIHVDYPLSYPERKYPNVRDDYDYAPFFRQLRDYGGRLTIEADIPADWNRAGTDARELLSAYEVKGRRDSCD